jgi:hypothetical protein
MSEQFNPYVFLPTVVESDIRPGDKYYLYKGFSCCVASVGAARDYAVYCACISWSLRDVYKHGSKVSREEARDLFPVLDQQLKYRM